MDDRYGGDVLAKGWRDAGRRVIPDVEASVDLVVEVDDDGFCGAVTAVRSGQVELEDRHGKIRVFPLGAGFLVDGAPVRLVPPVKRDAGRMRTASGSFVAPEDAGARRSGIAHSRRGSA